MRLANLNRHSAALILVLLAGLLLCNCGGSETAFDLSPLALEGREVAAARGCTACHGDDGEGIVGPSWQGLLGSQVLLEGGTTVIADEAYLRRAIVDPESEVVAGVTISMPIMSLTDTEVTALVAYIKEL